MFLLVQQGVVGHPNYPYQFLPSLQIDTRSVTVLRESSTFPIEQFWMLFIDCCLLSVKLGNVTCLNSMPDIMEDGQNTQCHSNSNRFTASQSSNANQFLKWLTVAHFVFPRTFIIPHCQKHSVLFFSLLLPFSREVQMKMHSINFLLLNIIAIQVSKCFQMLYNDHLYNKC